MRFEDLSGKRFGRLTVISRAENDQSERTRWLCKCDCGNEKIICASSLKCGTKSCGCYRREVKTTHGGKGTRLHRIWENMKARCYNPKNTAYSRYGGRGIKICAEWASFENFRNWAVGAEYSDALTIDRINVNGGYCPTNCRWVKRKVQQNNLSTNHVVEYGGDVLSTAQWAEKLGISYTTLLGRFQKDWDTGAALLTPVQKRCQ